MPSRYPHVQLMSNHCCVVGVRRSGTRRCEYSAQGEFFWVGVIITLIRCFCSAIFFSWRKKNSKIVSLLFTYFSFCLFSVLRIYSLFFSLEGVKKSMSPGGTILVLLNIFCIPLSH